MTQTTTDTLYCYVHPTRETGLRCNNCNRPICAECAVHTPTGYRCRECVKMQQKVFDTALGRDYVLGFIVAAALSLGAAFLVTIVISIGFGIIGWFLLLAGAPTAGVIIAEAVRKTTGKRRSRPLFLTVGAGVIAGALPDHPGCPGQRKPVSHTLSGDLPGDCRSYCICPTFWNPTVQMTYNLLINANRITYP